MVTTKAAFIEDVDLFDAGFFGISPREALAMDPQQRLLLELSWHALEDAGVPADQVLGSDTGVFIGISSSDYASLQRPLENLASVGPYFGTGTSASFAAGRLSYILGLHGPSFAVDTACSSSLVAVHLACRSLLAHECDFALAGGVNLMLSPLGGVYVSQIRSVSPQGRCRPYDEAADGNVRVEGAAGIV
jgi:acyl transferase domain-containing protein